MTCTSNEKMKQNFPMCVGPWSAACEYELICAWICWGGACLDAGVALALGLHDEGLLVGLGLDDNLLVVHVRTLLLRKHILQTRRLNLGGRGECGSAGNWKSCQQ